MTARRLLLRGAVRGVAAFLVVAAIALPLYSAFRVVDDRNQRRQDNAAALGATQTKAAVNAARIRTLAATTRATCAALNIDADRLNKVLDYVEIASKTLNPGPQTDRFFAGLPRPTVIDCEHPRPPTAPLKNPRSTP